MHLNVNYIFDKSSWVALIYFKNQQEFDNCNDK